MAEPVFIIGRNVEFKETQTCYFIQFCRSFRPNDKCSDQLFKRNLAISNQFEFPSDSLDGKTKRKEQECIHVEANEIKMVSFLYFLLCVFLLWQNDINLVYWTIAQDATNSFQYNLVNESNICCSRFICDKKGGQWCWCHGNDGCYGSCLESLCIHLLVYD